MSPQVIARRPSGARPPGRWLPVLAGVPLVGGLVSTAPSVAAGLTALLAVAAGALASPSGFITAAGLLATGVPKAGFVVSGFPLPLVLFVLLLAALLLRWRGSPSVVQRRGTRLAIGVLIWLAYRLVAMRLDGGGLGDMLALAGWYGLPILLLLVGPPLGSVRGRVGARWLMHLEWGLLFACLFSVLQKVFGLQRTSIAGITIARGADYSAKPIFFAGGSKIPSTYQNGNIFGVVTAFFFLIAAERLLARRPGKRDRLILAGTAVATLLSGSRTVLIGLALGLVLLILRSGLNRRLVTIFVLTTCVSIGVLATSPALANRITSTRPSDPNLSVRTLVWKRVVHSTPLPELLVGGPKWAQRDATFGLAEGIFGAVQQVGIIGMGLLIGAFLAATSAPELRRWRLLLIPVAVSLVVDSAYLVFPTLFIPVATMFSPLRADSTSEGSGKSEPSSSEDPRILA